MVEDSHPPEVRSDTSSCVKLDELRKKKTSPQSRTANTDTEASGDCLIVIIVQWSLAEGSCLGRTTVDKPRSNKMTALHKRFDRGCTAESMDSWCAPQTIISGYHQLNGSRGFAQDLILWTAGMATSLRSRRNARLLCISSPFLCDRGIRP